MKKLVLVIAFLSSTAYGQVNYTPAVRKNIEAQNINSVRKCDQFTGSTAGAKMVACIANLPSTGGTADARGLTGTQTWATNPFNAVTKPVDFWCSGSTITLTTNVTVPANVTLHFGTGCTFAGASTLTISGKIDNPQNAQIFSPTLPINLAGGNAPYPEWFGGKPDGSTNNSTALQAAIDSFTGNANPYGTGVGPTGGGWSTIKFSPGVYVLTSGVTISQSGIHLEGAGYSSTILRFQPTAHGTLLTFKDTAYPVASSAIHDVGVTNMTLDATGSSLSYVKTALGIFDVSEMIIQNVLVRDFSDTTRESTCFEIHGREQIIFSNIPNAFCNKAVYIGEDANASNEGLDRSTFSDVVLGNLTSIAEGSSCVTTKPVIEITEADAFLTNVTFSGYDLICGSYGVYWTAANNKTAGSNNVSFRHGRNEAQVTVPDWVYYIVPDGSGGTIFGLSFDDVSAGAPSGKGGWYLRNVYNGSMNDVTYHSDASVAVLDMDSSVNMGITNANLNLHSAQYTALNNWCGMRYGLDTATSNTSTGQTYMRSCGLPQVILESQPGGTTYTVSGISCSGNQMTVTFGTQLRVGGTIVITGVVNSGGSASNLANGSFDITAVDPTTATVTNDRCEAGISYASGGTNALIYGPQSYIGTNSTLSGQVAGDLALRSDGANILLGFTGTTALGITPGYLATFDTAGTTAKAYIGSSQSILSGYATDDLQIRSEASNILFGFSGNTKTIMPSGGGITFVSGSTTPTGASGSVSFGSTTQSAGVGACPSTVTVNGSPTAPTGCIVVDIGGTGRSIPFF